MGGGRTKRLEREPCVGYAMAAAHNSSSASERGGNHLRRRRYDDPRRDDRRSQPPGRGLVLARDLETARSSVLCECLGEGDWSDGDLRRCCPGGVQSEPLGSRRLGSPTRPRNPSARSAGDGGHRPRNRRDVARTSARPVSRIVPRALEFFERRLPAALDARGAYTMKRSVYLVARPETATKSPRA